MGQWDFVTNFFLYLVVTLPIMAIGIFIFQLTTPYNEFELIREGSNASDPTKAAAAKAAAHDLGGKIIGLAIVLASAVFHAVSLWDLALWGLIGVVFQVGVFYLFEWVTPFRVISEIPKGNVSVGLFASRLSIATGLLLAALISY
jgi:putative membrane protein